jgi:hypothetical protein
MKKENKNENVKKEQEKDEVLNQVLEGKEIEPKKIKFYKKVWYSITKFDKYLEMGLEGVGRAIKYLLQITALFVFIIALIGLYDTNKNLKEFKQNIQENVPDFKYSEGIVTLNSEENKIYKLTDSSFGLGTIIIDLNTEDEKTISEYESYIVSNKENTKTGIIILKDKIIQVSSVIGNDKSKGVVSLTYDEILQNLFGSSNIELTKQNLLDYLDGQGKTYIYVVNFVSNFIAYFILYILSGIVYVLVLTLIGYLSGIFTKIRLRFSVVFNMSVYAFTLSNILYMIYFVVNYFTGITFKYFNIAYIAIAYVYLVTIIFLIKIDFFKKQEEKLKEAKKDEKGNKNGQEQI